MVTLIALWTEGSDPEVDELRKFPSPFRRLEVLGREGRANARYFSVMYQTPSQMSPGGLSMRWRQRSI